MITADASPQSVQDALLVPSKVNGEPFVLPDDLYIPPDALTVLLEAFEGPLDLLLYLIRRQRLDVLNIPIAEITRQYVSYIELMECLRIELAAEYLVMAAVLAEIKSRFLLPRTEQEGETEEDPRAQLVRRLQIYEAFKKAAEDLDALPRRGRDLFVAQATLDPAQQINQTQRPTVELKELLFALQDVLQRAALFDSHHIEREPLSLRERMANVLSRTQGNDYIDFSKLFDAEEGRQGVVITFLAILELIKENLLEVVQNQAFATIFVRAQRSQ